jgi:hypothetical protein
MIAGGLQQLVDLSLGSCLPPDSTGEQAIVGQGVGVAPMVNTGALAQAPLTQAMGAQPLHQGRLFRIVELGEAASR